MLLCKEGFYRKENGLISIIFFENNDYIIKQLNYSKNG